MWARILRLILVSAALSSLGAMLVVGSAGAQLIDFSKIDAFESLSTGTQSGASPPKTIVDDGNRHIVLFTILEANADAKVYWRAFDGDPPDRTTVISGPGCRHFRPRASSGWKPSETKAVP